MSSTEIRSDLKEILLANNSSKQFRYLAPTDLTYIRSQLAELLGILGIKTMLTDLDVETLKIFISTQFKSNTFDDLKLAISLNSARKLETYHQHYQLLNTDFVGAILTDYNELLRKASIELVKARENVAEAIVKLPEAKDSAYLMIKNYYEENKSFPMAANWSSAFDWMWSNGLTEDKEMMAKWFEVESEKVKKEIIDSMFYAKNVAEKRLIEMKLEGNFVRLECRKRYVQKMIAI